VRGQARRRGCQRRDRHWLSGATRGTTRRFAWGSAAASRHLPSRLSVTRGTAAAKSPAPLWRGMGTREHDLRGRPGVVRRRWRLLGSCCVAVPTNCSARGHTRRWQPLRSPRAERTTRYPSRGCCEPDTSFVPCSRPNFAH
jgi:hypothetical protein